MHAHKDDEILSYMRSGTMLHLDNMGNEEAVTNQRMMLMNAGHTFQHEEKMLEPVSMLQIFLRPRVADLEPVVQFHSLSDVLSNGEWRMLAGPKGAAPLEVRAQAWVQDMRLNEDTLIALPPVPTSGVTRLLYAFNGLVSIEGTVLSAGESLILDNGTYEVAALETSDLVLFTTETAAPVFKGGMFSGNIFSK